VAREVTNKGAAFYGVTSGTRLTPEIVAAARQRNGGKRAPAGSTTQTRVASREAAPRARTRAPEAVVSLSARPASVSTAAQPETKVPTVFGEREVTIDGLRWRIPSDARVVSNKVGTVVQVLTTEGGYHVLVRQRRAVRELVMTPATAAKAGQLFREKYFPGT
jgi:hypothetical protein